jgi:hypothetical protein
MKYSWLLLFLVGCATLTPEAKMVRTITPGVAVAQGCTHLGMAQAFNPAIEGGMSAAQITIRNRVAARKGNAMVVTSQDSSGGHGEITADVYACP